MDAATAGHLATCGPGCRPCRYSRRLLRQRRHRTLLLSRQGPPPLTSPLSLPARGSGIALGMPLPRSS
eukprot:952707-Pyramimonas_sp.AAC.1